MYIGDIQNTNIFFKILFSFGSIGGLIISGFLLLVCILSLINVILEIKNKKSKKDNEYKKDVKDSISCFVHILFYLFISLSITIISFSYNMKDEKTKQDILYETIQEYEFIKVEEVIGGTQREDFKLYFSDNDGNIYYIYNSDLNGKIKYNLNYENLNIIKENNNYIIEVPFN